MAKSERQRREARRSRRILIGAGVSLLVIIGIISIISTVVSGIQILLDDSDEKLLYADFIAPLVQLDPLPFDSLDSAPQDTLIQAAIWLAFTEEDSTTFERNEFGSAFLPTAIVDGYALTLYGPDFVAEHKTFIDSGLEFVYDEEKKAYVIPITAQLTTYNPIVEEIDNDGDDKILTVGYLLPAGTSLGNLGNEDVPIKYLNYVLTKNGNNYYISAIEQSDKKPETESSTPTASSEPLLDNANILDERAQEIQAENSN